MYGLTSTMGLIKCEGRTRGLAAVAMTALIFLSALPPKARAQFASTNTYGGTTVVHEGTIGLVPGQSVSVSVPNYQFSDGSVRYLKHSIKVYEVQPNGVTENESGLIYSGESGGINESAHEVGHVFTFRHEHLRVAGEPGTGRIQVWIVVESFLPSATETQTEDRCADVSQPSLELIDDGSGKTVVFTLLLPAIQK
jgi:hypothetical protein